ncbi:MAG: hypothetical protein R6X17_06575 [Candidatus Competibacteraceae bacterium]
MMRKISSTICISTALLSGATFAASLPAGTSGSGLTARPSPVQSVAHWIQSGYAYQGYEDFLQDIIGPSARLYTWDEVSAALRSATIENSINRICSYRGGGSAVCVEVDAMLDQLAPETAALVRLGFNDMARASGAPAGNHVLFGCGDGASPFATGELFSLPGSGGLSPNVVGAISGDRGSVLSGPLSSNNSLSSGDLQYMAQTCAGSFGAAYGGGSQGLTNAIAATEQKVRERIALMCRGGANPTVVNPGEGGGSRSTIQPPSTTTNNRGDSAEEMSQLPDAGDVKNVIDLAENLNNIDDGTAGLIEMTQKSADIGANGAKGGKAAADLVGGVFGLASLGFGVAADNADAQGDSQGAAGLNLIAGVMDGLGALVGATHATMVGVEAAEIAGVATTTGMTGAGLGTTAAAAGAGTVFGVVLGTAFASYSITRAAMEFSGADAKLDALMIEYADAQYAREQGGSSQFLPSELDGVASPCDSAQDWWNAFSAYCSASNWQTYDCQKTLSFFTGCADPALINPGPEGSWSCRVSDHSNHGIDEAFTLQCQILGMTANYGPDGGPQCSIPGMSIPRHEVQCLVDGGPGCSPRDWSVNASLPRGAITPSNLLNR